jgi:hypothetical protein
MARPHLGASMTMLRDEDDAPAAAATARGAGEEERMLVILFNCRCHVSRASGCLF